MTTALAPDVDTRDPLQRLADLADPGTLDVDAVGAGSVGSAGSGVAAGLARLHGAPTVVFATDPRVQGGALGGRGADRIAAAYDDALARCLPIVGVWQSGGARLAEGVASLDGMGRIFAAMVRASGTVPQVSLVLGPAAGGAAYGPALTDLVVTGPGARVFVTGPDVVRSVTGEDLDAEALGGPGVVAASGVAHVTAASDSEALAETRRLVALLARPTVPAPVHRGPDPGACLPESRRRAYDVRPLVDALLDGPLLALQPRWAPNVVTGLGRLEGRTVGVLATNPLRLAGCLTASASEKAARFVRLCDGLGVPLVVVVDVPGYLPGGRQEAEGVVRRGAKLLHAFAAASVPRVTVITRKAYGGAYIALNSRALGATRVLAWPGAEVDVMSPVAAVQVLRRRELAAVPAAGRAAAEASYAAAHAATTGGLARALDEGYVDEVVAPGDTRAALAAAFAAAPAARGRLGNIPL